MQRYYIMSIIVGGVYIVIPFHVYTHYIARSKRTNYNIVMDIVFEQSRYNTFYIINTHILI